MNASDTWNMDLTCQNSSLSAEYLLEQLNTARREINNLRQQIRSLKYIFDKDVSGIKHLLEVQKDNESLPRTKLISSEEAKPGTSKDDDTLKLKPIGIISTWFPNKRATPRQPGVCGKVPGKLTLYNSVFTNPDHALQGLQDFSHMWILFHFHRNDSTHTRAKVAPPRLNGVRTGVFSTRSPHRPCPIGLSLVKILKIEDNVVYFEGVDMVNQTPVLDIKPYIPQYDSPLHIEKSVRLLENSEANIPDDMFRNATEETASVGPFANDSTDNANADERTNIDVSRDEEIALRLQAEEFEAYPYLGDYDVARQSSHLLTEPHVNVPVTTSSSLQSGANTDIGHREAYLHMRTPDPRSDHANSSADSEILRELSSRLRDVDVSDNPGDASSAHDARDNNESNYTENQTLRNSRLLDGADGPSTVCGTDVDLVSRHVLQHTRVDNSPVRMGVREAPDGEEGLESSQSLTPSRTLPDIHNATATTTAAAAPQQSEPASNTPAESNFSEIRVPDWISQPRAATLSVIFNERALMQLNEILDDKVEEQKHAIENVLREDPRSVYLRQRWGSQFYTFLIHDLHITCRFDDGRGVVTVFQVRHAGRTCDCGEPEWQCLGHSPLS